MSYDSTAISYDPSAPVSSQRNAVRFLLQDNGQVETFTDDEVDAYLATSSNVWGAAVDLASLLVDRVSQRTAGKSTVKYQNIINRIPEWRRRAQTYSSAAALGDRVLPSVVQSTDS